MELGRIPAFDIQRSHRFPIGLIDVRLNVSKGIITVAKYMVIFGSEDIEDLENFRRGQI